MKKKLHLNLEKDKKYGYLGNDNVLRHGVKYPYTQDEVQEYLRCKKSPNYFVKNWCKIIHMDHGLIPFDLYPYQDKMFDQFEAERFNIILSTRQSGKTTALVGYLLWNVLFHPETPVCILAHKAAGAREVLERIALALENLPYFLQPGCRALNKGNIDFSNNSKLIAASTANNSIRGKSQKIIYLDEFAFVPHADEFWGGTYPTISSGKTTKVIITSTLNGPCNLFYNLWEGALQGTNDFKPIRVDWWDVPGRDEAWAEETRRNIGLIRWQQEYENKVIGAANSLISPDALMRIKKVDPLKITNNKVNIYEYPEAGARYILFVDVARGRGLDYSTFNVIKIGDGIFEQVATFRDNMMSPLLFPDVIVKYATYYNEAMVVVESNDAGQVVCNGIYYELEYENLYVESAIKRNALGVTMTQKVKRIGCSNLKDLIELDRLKIKDKETILELSNFVEKGKSYQAEGDGHDDLVMNLVLFAYFTSLSIFEELTDSSLRILMKEEREKMMEEDIPFFGIMDSSDPVISPEMQSVIEQQKAWNLG